MNMENEQETLLGKQNVLQRKCTSTRMKVMLYALIYNCAFTITTTVEPQFVYSYIKHHNDFNMTHMDKNRTTNLDTRSCQDNSTTIDSKIQQLSSDWLWYMNLAEAGVALPVIMVVGPIADRIGRKPVLMWCLIVTFISFVFKTLIVYNDMNMYYYTSACALLGLAGSFYAYQITNFAILADVTDGGKDRSFMMTLYDALSAVGIVSFQIGTGYLIQIIGFTDPYIISSAMFLFMCVFVQVTLQDSWIPPDTDTKPRFTDIIRELFLFCLKQENMNTQFTLTSFSVEFMAYCLFYIPHCILYNILTIYQLGPPFCWTSEHIGLYGAGASFVSFIGGVIILKLVHVIYTSVKDETTVLWGIVSYLSNYILYGVSFEDWMMYAAIPSGIVRLLPISLLRALLSQMVHRDKQGVLYSAIHVMEVVSRIGASTLFNNIYHHTLQIYSGLVFFVMAGFVFVAFILMIYARCTLRSRCMELEKEKPEIQVIKNRANS